MKSEHPRLCVSGRHRLAGDVTLRSETYPLEHVNDVLAKLRDGEITGRAVLVP